MEIIKEVEALAVKIFNDFDEDKSKSWNKDEFHTFVVRSLFIQLDKNKDQKLAREEINIKSEQQFDAFMEKLDLNSDGILNWDEFKAVDMNTERYWMDLTDSEESELSFDKVKPSMSGFLWLFYH